MGRFRVRKGGLGWEVVKNIVFYILFGFYIGKWGGEKENVKK